MLRRIWEVSLIISLCIIFFALTAFLSGYGVDESVPIWLGLIRIAGFFLITIVVIRVSVYGFFVKITRLMHNNSFAKCQTILRKAIRNRPKLEWLRELLTLSIGLSGALAEFDISLKNRKASAYFAQFGADYYSQIIDCTYNIMLDSSETFVLPSFSSLPKKRKTINKNPVFITLNSLYGLLKKLNDSNSKTIIEQCEKLITCGELLPKCFAAYILSIENGKANNQSKEIEYMEMALAYAPSDEVRDILSSNDKISLKKYYTAEKKEHAEISNKITTNSIGVAKTHQNSKMQGVLLLLFVLSLFSFHLALALAHSITGTNEHFGENMWVAYTLLPFPVSSLILGIVYIERGYRTKKNIISGAIIAALLVLFGTMSIGLG